MEMNEQIAKVHQRLGLPHDDLGNKFATNVLEMMRSLCEGYIIVGMSRTATLIKQESPESMHFSLDMFEPAGKTLIEVRFDPTTNHIVEVL